MKPYSQDLRERVVRACEDSVGSRRQIAALFGVSTSWIRRLFQRRRETGTLAPLPSGGAHNVKMDEDRCGRLLLLVTEQPDASLAELHQRLGAPVHVSTIARTLIRMGLTVKKKSFGPASRIGPTSAKSGRPFARGSRTSIPTAWSFSMKSAPTPR